jgi:hypothetical protein
MPLLCRILHRWTYYEAHVVRKNPRPDMKRLVRVIYGETVRERRCKRCGKVQRHSPGLHHPPYWKDKKVAA